MSHILQPLHVPAARPPSLFLRRTSSPPPSFATVGSYQSSDLRSTTRAEIVLRIKQEALLDMASCDCPSAAAHASGDCAECVQVCEEAACAVQLTPLCTDQCVVIPCDDAHHPFATPAKSGPHDAMSVDDDDSAAALDEFCCSNIQGYFADSRSFTDVPIANDGFTWDPAVLDALLRTPSNSGGGGGGNGPATSMNFPAPPMPAPPHHSYPPPAPLTCMWGNCRAAFRSLSELVGHVNLQHLHPQPPAPPAAAAPADTRSCLWGDCDVFPSPASVPGPSSGDHEDSMRGVLASHLFQDHLGLPPVPQPQPQPQPLVTPSSSSASSPAASCPPTPVPEHDCSAPSAHVCRWRGCGHTFASCDALTAHITAAHVGAGKARYHCFWDGCTRNGESGFASKQKICRHMQSHTGHRPFRCEVCAQNFSEAATLAQHMRRHTQEKPYVCDFPGCGKAFAITGALTIHKRMHNGHKPFKCTYCERAFAESSNLSKHLRTHTGARPYMCTHPGCNKSFARPDQLTRHASVHRRKGAADEAEVPA